MSDIQNTPERDNADIRKTDGESGFTLVEVLTVLAIIAIITTAVVVNVFSITGTAKVKRAQVDISTLSSAIEQYNLDIGTYPDERDGLNALRELPAGARNAELYRQGGYIKKLPTDPWGSAYIYRYPGDYGAYDIYSFGADGVEGGEGDNADVTSWEE
ncbi:type II secretion system major pseudopilin GspG [Robiginitomaculum antarcticum]|uniref:type II secretion system major pseudopilin GspG n=1 Tax=Robiginitomaculum antarcticum TaxID=437507 RepID=UPI0003823A94|nr:type II secretion system major pseudopilin GspG [Robiginitomaculum antarcticum]